MTPDRWEQIKNLFDAVMSENTGAANFTVSKHGDNTGNVVGNRAVVVVNWAEELTAKEKARTLSRGTQGSQ